MKESQTVVRGSRGEMLYLDPKSGKRREPLIMLRANWREPPGQAHLVALTKNARNKQAPTNTGSHQTPLELLVRV